MATAAEVGACLGCMDSEACNFDPTASEDDNSCLYLDCHGDCGGTAIDSDCGCIGGNTGHSTHACIDGCLNVSFSTAGEGCAPGLLHGQTFVAESSGHLQAIRLMTCCAVDVQLVLREHVDLDACDNTTAWNEGTILGSGSLLEATCDNLTNCLVSSGLDGYQWQTIPFEDILLEAGRSYTLELTSGVALATCGDDYPGGHAFYISEPSSSDMAMELLSCIDGVTLGCTDPPACDGYDPGATHDDGSCLYADCHGSCGGSAHEAGPCGCLGGNTGIRDAQCVDGTLHGLIANDGPICTGTLSGQDILVPDDVFLLLGEFNVDPTASQSMVLERLDGPLAGLELGTAERAAESDPCASGESYWRALEFGGIPLQGGMHYRLTFTQGDGHRTCDASYADGQGLNSTLNSTTSDLAFRLVVRTPDAGELTWGCTDSGACNFNAGATHDDGSCADFDCHGDCGGTAVFIEGCGCAGGNTDIPMDSCYGCTDPMACNYDSEAPIDDASCAYSVDCHGDCGGSAILSPECGCTGGNSGLDSENCLAFCQGIIDLSTYPDDPDVLNDPEEIAFSQCGQTFTADANVFLTGTRIRTLSDVTGSNVTVELRLDNADDVHEGTLLATAPWSSVQEGAGIGFDVFVEWPDPVLLEPSETYVLIFHGIDWLVIRSDQDLLADGASFNGGDEEADLSDFYFELMTCDDLYGCTSPAACNHEDWATQDNGSCTYPDPGFQCDGTPCTQDDDGDGICAGVDLDDTDPSVCFDGDADGCDDCSSGTYDPAGDGPDIDGDGLCDLGDLCSDPEADNFDDPANGPCQGECDNAPIFEGVQVAIPASDPWSEDGLVALSFSEGGFPFANSSGFTATTLQLTGLNGSPDYLLDLATDDLIIQPGWYAAILLNSAGCPGVGAAVHGSTFGQGPILFPLFMTYSLCCGDCGDNDLDQDMICDSEDECTDKNALNYDDPANEPCEY